MKNMKLREIEINKELNIITYIYIMKIKLIKITR